MNGYVARNSQLELEGACTYGARLKEVRNVVMYCKNRDSVPRKANEGPSPRVIEILSFFSFPKLEFRNEVLKHLQQTILFCQGEWQFV